MSSTPPATTKALVWGVDVTDEGDIEIMVDSVTIVVEVDDAETILRTLRESVSGLLSFDGDLRLTVEGVTLTIDRPLAGELAECLNDCLNEMYDTNSGFALPTKFTREELAEIDHVALRQQWGLRDWPGDNSYNRMQELVVHWLIEGENSVRSSEDGACMSRTFEGQMSVYASHLLVELERAGWLAVTARPRRYQIIAIEQLIEALDSGAADAALDLESLAKPIADLRSYLTEIFDPWWGPGSQSWQR